MHHLVAGIHTADRHDRFESARVNSGKSNTYIANVVQRIIGGKPAAKAKDAKSPSRAKAPVVPAVMRITVDEGSEGQRLDNFLVKLLKGVPKTHVYRVIRSGEVRVNKGRAQADTRLAMGDEVRVPPVRMADKSGAAPVPAREFPIVFEDEHLVAVDKPAGVAVHGGSGVSFGVIEQLRQARPEARFLELVHRLDKETSGLLLVAKKRSALTALQDQFRGRETGKTYAALVSGAWPASKKVIDVALHKFLTAEGERRVKAVADDHVLRQAQGDRSLRPAQAGRRSITLVKVMKQYDGFSLLDVTIKTGRTHQIRVHLASEGHPIVGDEKYGDFALNKALSRGEAPQAHRFDRMFLHARRLRFTHPSTGETIELEAPLPPECRDFLAVLAS